MTGIQLYASALSLVADIESPEGADPEALAPQLAAWFDASEDKIGAYAHVLARLDAEDAALKAEQDAFAAARKSLATQRERVRELVALLLESMEQLGEEPKVKRVGFSAYFMATESVIVPASPDDYPEQYQRVSISPDKAAIKASLKAGDDVAGCSLATARSLVVRISK